MRGDSLEGYTKLSGRNPGHSPGVRSMRRTVCKTVPCYILSLTPGSASILFKGWMSVFVNRNDTDEHRVDNQRNQRNLRENSFCLSVET